MKICKNCNIEYQDSMKFCPECGTKLESKPNVCPNCGTEYNDGQKFCSECGTRLVNIAANVQTTNVFSKDIVDLCNLGIEYYEKEQEKYGVSEDELAYKKAVQCFMKAVEVGFPKAMLYLGLCYDEGKGIEADAEKSIQLKKTAISWYKKEAEAGNVEAQFELGNCYYNNFYVDEDEEQATKEAFKWYTKAVESGDTRALVQLARCHRYYNKDINKAIELYIKAAAAGSIEAMNDLGEFYRYEVDDSDKAIEWFTKAAISGSLDAMCDLGGIYRDEVDDSDKAIEWFTKAAISGSLDAMCDLGGIYRDEVEDYDKAIEWYTKAAISGSDNALNEIDHICRYNLEDCEKAIELFSKIADTGSIEALIFLGDTYENDYAKAINCYSTAAKKGSIKALQKLGREYCFLDDYDQAIVYFTQAVEHKCIEANLELADIYCRLGKYRDALKYYDDAIKSGVSKFYGPYSKKGDCYFEQKAFSSAVECYNKGVEEGERDSLERLGDCCFLGLGKVHDYKEAYNYYKKSIGQFGPSFHVKCMLEEFYDNNGNVKELESGYKLEIAFKELLNRSRMHKGKQLLCAAKKGDPKSQYEVAKCYYYGTLYWDKKQATEWFRKAAAHYRKLAEDGDRCAQMIIGDCLSLGETSDDLREKSHHWYELAAEAGLPEAQCIMGDILKKAYRDGVHLKAKLEQAIQWYEKASQAGNIDAKYALGEMFDSYYFYHHLDNSKRPLAFSYFKDAAELGHSRAQYKLALYYEEGDVVSKNIDLAYKWYKQSFVNGEFNALLGLDRLEKEYPNISKDFERAKTDSSNTYSVKTENSAIDKCIPHVFFIKAKGFDITYPDGKRQQSTCGEDGMPSWTGTGFLLSDGRFVTARHVVEAWAFPSGGGQVDEAMVALNLVANNGGKVVAKFEALSSNGTKIQFSSDQCVINHRNDSVQLTEKGAKMVVARMSYDDTDYAYFHSGHTSGLGFNISASTSLAMRTELVALGFPLGIGANSETDINPIYGSGIVAKSGLQNGVILTTDTNYEQGNSGGPVFITNNNGNLEVIGLVSAGAGRTMGFIVPIAAVK